MARRIIVEVFLMIAAGMLLGLIGPFGTFENPLPLRLTYWVLMLLAGYPLFRGMNTVARWLTELANIPHIVALALTLAIAALPMTLIVAALFMRLGPLAAIQAPGIGLLYFEVWLIGLVMNSAMQLLMRRADDPALVTTPPSAAPAMPSAPALAPEDTTPPPVPDAAPVPLPPALPLPPGFGPLLALKGEDHYVRAIAAGREELLLMRLRDAIAMLPAEAGTQVHRSWWVARAAVTGTARDGRNAFLLLGNGDKIPVSRDKLSALRAAGWI